MHLVRIRRPGAERVSNIIQRPERFLATVLLGNNLVNTAAAALATVLALELITNESLSVLAATAGVTAFLLLFGETVPKNVCFRCRFRRSNVCFSIGLKLVIPVLRIASLNQSHFSLSIFNFHLDHRPSCPYRQRQEPP